MGRDPIDKNTIVIIATDSEERGFMCAALENEGYKVESADNGNGGLKISEKTFPNVIILDLDITDMNGADFCRAVTQNNRWQLSIIVLSSKAELSVKLSSFVAGATRFLEKPVKIEELLKEVEYLAASKERKEWKENLY